MLLNKNKPNFDSKALGINRRQSYKSELVHNLQICTKNKPELRFGRTIALCLLLPATLVQCMPVFAADTLIKTIPKRNYAIPAGDLSDALPAYAAESGVLLGFDPILTQGKRTKGLKGQYGQEEGFKTLLKDSGLEVVADEKGQYTLQRAKVVVDDGKNLPEQISLKDIPVRAQRFYEVGPLPGLGLTKEQIPGNVQSISAKEIQEARSLSMADLLNQNLQSVNVNDYQGNPFQMDVTYRGFTAGPQIGTPQGLSVFLDGIRVNEPFGDVVNWDMIPMNALSGVDVFPGSNPIFGLGTLGGAFSMKTKDGFSHKGVTAEVLTGSFGRKQLQATGGWNNGTVGLFGAGNFFLEDGWRENSPSRVNQMFGKASYRGEKLDLNLSSLVVWNDLVGNGLVPSEMYKQDRNGVYTSPDSTDNRLFQFQLSGSYFVNDNFTVTAQAYRRDSKRHSVGADVYTEYEKQSVKRNLLPGEQYTCLFTTTNKYNLPDYHVLDIPGGDPLNPDQFDPLSSSYNPTLTNFLFSPTLDDAFATLGTGSLNQKLPDELVALAQNNFFLNKNFLQSNIFTPSGEGLPFISPGPVTTFSFGNASYQYSSAVNLSSIKDSAIAQDPIGYYLNAVFSFYYYTPDNVAGDGVPTLHLLLIKPPTNFADCKGDTGGEKLEVPGPQGGVQTVDGAAYNNTGTGTGVVQGTPTSVLTENQINQITDGASVQLNWNFEKHKFMVGASIDAPSATYKSGQRLGLLDANRNAFLAPDQIRDQYAAADTEISNNNFTGSQITKSIYASETWSPIETLHFTGSARYNDTHGKNKIASRTYGSYVFNLAQLEAFPDYFDVCKPGEVCQTGYVIPDASNLLNKPEKEKFSYYSLNPSFGVSWQAKPNLNFYTNWAQGTRTPSVIELGCAFDDTPLFRGFKNDPITNQPTTEKIFLEKSLAENRSCSLPSTLSGDPPLPQIRAQTIDVGMRGTWGNNLQWNLGAYQTDLKDDIYLVTFPGNRSFFDSIGNTRRRGIEAGIKGVYDKISFKLNYALTEATFQDSFKIASNDNSSAVEDFFGNYEFGKRIQVKPGDRMPGVPLHNLNATLSYQLTPKWQASLIGVAHSMSFVRGNENNEHQAGVQTFDTMENSSGLLIKVPRRVTTNPGTVDGYMTFNFRTSYQLTPEWRLGLLVNNIFDKEYFSAGRLGRNPFSPSIYGAIGPDGYNHNSTDWLSTNFLAPGAPRGVWLSLTYEFQPDKK